MVRSHAPGMTTAATFGRRVKALRKHRDLTQEQLADRMERSVDSISQIERGVNLPSFETLDRLSRALDVPMKEFFEDLDVDDSRRAEMLTIAMAVLRDLSDEDLLVAIEQITALRKRS